MKKGILILIIMGLLLISTIAAENFNVTEIRIYIGDTRAKDADKTGGEIEANRGDTIKFRIELKNSNKTRDYEDINFWLTAYSIKKNGDDIEVGKETVEMVKDSKKKIDMEFTIPTDAIFDFYDLELTIKDEEEIVNDWSQEWELEVVEVEVEEESELLKNISNRFDEVDEQYDSFMGTFEQTWNCSFQLIDVTRGHERMIQERNDWRGKYYSEENLSQTCISDKTTCEIDRDDYSSGRDNCLVALDTVTIDRDSRKKNLPLIIIAAVLAGGVIYHLFTAPPKPKTEAGQFEDD